MSRRLAAAAWGFPIICLGLVVTMIVRVPDHDIVSSIAGSAVPLAFATTGAVIASRRPRNGIGWLLCVFSLTIPLEELAEVAVLTDPAPGRLLIWTAWAAGWIWAPLLTAFVSYLPLTFPTGRIRGPLATAVIAVAAIGAAMVATGNALQPGDAGPIVNPVAVAGHDDLLESLTEIGVIPVGIAALVSIAMLIRRYRRSSGAERRQLKWFVFAMFVAIIGAVANGVLYETGNEAAGQVAFGVGFVWLPVALAVAILRHNLYDIDRLISRTVAYALVTAGVVAVYVAAVTALTSVTSTGTRESPIVVAAATLIAAAAIQPLRQRFQGAVDRRFNRARYDAQRTVDAYRARLRDELDLEAIAAGLVDAARVTVEPRAAIVWTAPPEP